MAKLRNNQTGFGTVEALLILVILVLIGVVGYMVYNNHHKTAAPTVVTTVKTSTTPKTPTVNPVVYTDSTGSVYAIDLEATTATQKGIAAALDTNCASGPYPVADKVVAITGLPNLFTANTTNFQLEDNFAKVNQGCYDETKGGAPDGGGALAFLKEADGRWVFITASQSEVDCSDFDNTGVPATIVSTCYDNLTNASRAPTP